jgi:hypothetical protein
MPSIIRATTTNGLQVAPDNSGSLQLQTNGTTTAVTIDTSQNVGIGTASPAYKLDVVGSLNVTADSFYRIGAGTDRYIQYRTGNSDILYSFSSGNFYRQDIGNSTHSWFTGNAERMRIDSSGNVLAGTTNSSDSAGAGCKIINLSSGVSPSVALVGSASTNGTGTGFQMYSTGAGSYRFYVGYGGTIFATATTITGISDQRVKENIVDLDEGLDAVMALKPRKFDWKEGKGKDIKGDRGFIAQEFETVFPDMIEEWKDQAPEGEEPYKAVNANIIPTLVKAIQEQQTIINDLKARIETLEAK